MVLFNFIIPPTIWFLNIIGITRFCIWLILKYIPSFMYKKWTSKVSPNDIKPCDVTAIIPVFYPEINNVIDACYSWKANKIKKIVLVANNDCFNTLKQKFYSDNIVDVVLFNQDVLIESGKPSKRHALASALDSVMTPIVIFADDDVFWEPHVVE